MKTLRRSPFTETWKSPSSGTQYRSRSSSKVSMRLLPPTLVAPLHTYTSSRAGGVRSPRFPTTRSMNPATSVPLAVRSGFSDGGVYTRLAAGPHGIAPSSVTVTVLPEIRALPIPRNVQPFLQSRYFER